MGCFYELKVAFCRDLFLRVLKLTKQPHMKYGKGKNKGNVESAQKVLYCHGGSTIA